MFADFTDRTWLWAAAGFYLAGFLLGTFSLLRGGRPSSVAMYGLIAAGYLLVGSLFAIWFVLVGAGRLDPAAREGSWGFRAMIFAGSVILCTYLALRVRR